MNRRAFLAAALSAAAAAIPAPSGAQAPPWPGKPVRIVVPFGPGGYTDTYARLVAGELAKTLGQFFIVTTNTGNYTLALRDTLPI